MLPTQLLRALFASLLISFSLGSGLFVVNTLSPSGSGSFPDAINQANTANGGTISFSVSGTITMTANLPQITSNIHIVGPGPAAITVDGASAYQLLVVNTGCTVTVSGLTFLNGHSIFNGAQDLTVYGTATVSDCVFQGWGGSPATSSVVYSTGILTVLSCWFANAANTPSLLVSAGSAVIRSSTFSGNSVPGTAQIQTSTASFFECTFANNNGGAIYALYGGIISIEGCSVLDTSVGGGNGAVTAGGQGGSTVSMQDSVVLGTVGGNDVQDNGGFQDLGHNVFGTFAGFTPNPSDVAVGIARSAAGIGSLANNGGPTPTCALQVGSPLIDAGSYQSSLGNFDQRGSPHARVSGPAMDIGAFELQQSGSGGGDPVFRGFRGQRFSFPGRRDRVFHIFSDASICINALFGAARPDLAKRSHGTVMAALSIRLALPARADPDENKPPPTNFNRDRSRSRSASAEWIAVARAEQRGQVEINTTAAEQLADDDHCVPQLHWSDNATRLEFVLPGRGNISFVWRTMATRHVNTTFLDIRIDEASFAPAAAIERAQLRSATPGGLLGITAKSKDMPEKAELDQRLYLTSHLLAVDALSCKYKARPLPCI